MSMVDITVTAGYFWAFRILSEIDSANSYLVLSHCVLEGPIFTLQLINL